MSDSNPTPLELRDVQVDVDGRTLVRGLDLRVEPGERVSIVGPNGAGKTTLLRALAGLHPLAGGAISRPDAHPGMHFQDGALWPHMTVAEHLAFVDVADDRAWRDDLLARFDLARLSDAKPDHLSGGERVRLGLARTFAGHPTWALLDEPLSHLDAATQARLRVLLPRIVAELGCAALTVTHDADDVALFGDRVLALDGEGGAWIGPAADALTSPPTASLAAFAGRGTLLHGTADDSGHVDFGHGLATSGAAPGREVVAVVAASDVVVTNAPGGSRFVAPDGRGGSWVRHGPHLLRSTTNPTDFSPGADVTVSCTSPPRVLEEAPR